MWYDDIRGENRAHFHVSARASGQSVGAQRWRRWRLCETANFRSFSKTTANWTTPLSDNDLQYPRNATAKPVTASAYDFGDSSVRSPLHCADPPLRRRRCERWRRERTRRPPGAPLRGVHLWWYPNVRRTGGSTAEHVCGRAAAAHARRRRQRSAQRVRRCGDRPYDTTTCAPGPPFGEELPGMWYDDIRRENRGQFHVSARASGRCVGAQRWRR